MRQRPPRVPLEARVVCRSGASASWSSLNVSESGVFVQGTPILAPGTELEVSLLLPRGIEVRGRARVVWNNHPDASAPVPGHPVGMGLQLVDLRESDREILRSQVAGLINDCLEELDRYRAEEVGSNVSTHSTESPAVDQPPGAADPEANAASSESTVARPSGPVRRVFSWMGTSDVAILGAICLGLSAVVAAVTWTLPWDSDGPSVSAVSGGPGEEERARQLLVEASHQIQRGDYSLAVETCQEVLRREPNSADAYRILATAHRFLGHRQQACESFERYLHNAPGAPDAEKVRESLQTCAQ